MGTFADISDLVGQLPGRDDDATAQAAACSAEAGLSGRFAELAGWMAGWQGRYPPQVDHARVCIFAGAHGIAVDEIASTAERLQAVVEGRGAVNRLVEFADADLKLFEMGLDHPTADFRDGPAMTEVEAITAIAYGMTAVEPGVQLLVVGSLGADEVVAATLAHSLLGGTPGDWADDDVAADIIAAGVGANGAMMGAPLQALAAVGGQEIAAIFGVLLAARAVQVPVLLDGFGACTAAVTLQAIGQGAADHTRIAYLEGTQASARLAGACGGDALLAPGLGIEVGGGTGALAIQMLRGAVVCHKNLVRD